MMLTKSFQLDFDKFKKMLEDGVPFSFTRFSDGEMFILQGKELILSDNFVKVGNEILNFGYKKNDHKDFKPDRHAFYQEELTKSFKHRQENYFKGISCPCCVGKANCQWMKDFHGAGDDEHLTWANIFVNSNYPRFIKEIVPLFSTRRIILVANADAKPEKLPFRVEKHFKIGPNALINDFGLVQGIGTYMERNDCKDAIFLLAASSLSNVLAYHLFNGSATFLDIGTTLNPLMDMGYDRDYLKGYWLDNGHPDFQKVCIWE